ncbi:hypothetical protein DFAR_2770043 [Desulfarculales bacterium]
MESSSTTAPTGHSLFSQNQTRRSVTHETKLPRLFRSHPGAPFDSDLAPKEIMQTAEALGVAKRFEYAIRLGALALVTGDVGGGKATALLWAPAGCTHPNIRSSGSPPHRAPFWNSTGKSTSSSKWTLPVFPRPSSPSSSENRFWRSPRTSRSNPSSSSMKPSSTGFKSWSSCTPPLSFRGLQANPAHHPGRSEQPRRPPHIQNFPAPGLQGRGQQSSGRRLPPGHAGLPPAPSQNRRRGTEPFS